MTKKWWHDAVVYQIYPRSFMDSNGDGIGDLPGIISKLDYLEKLGINIIWLSPVYESPMDDNGYDISDYQAIADVFGTMEDMDQLIAEADKRNIKIVMDLVVNHSSDEHPWFIESRKSRDNKYRDYYIWRDPVNGSFPNDMGSTFSGPAWTFDEQTGQYYFHAFSKRQPDLNWHNQDMVQEIYDMMNWWLDRGIGGFRLDVIDLIGKDIDQGIQGNGPTLHDHLLNMNLQTFGKKDVLTVGETWGATPEIAKLYSNPDRHELSMVFQFEHVTLSWDPEEGKWKPRPFNMKELKMVFNKWQTELGHEGWNSLFWNNHDLPRIVSKYGDTGKYRGKSAKMLATALHMQKGTPYIYQGEEIGMTNVAFESIDDYDDIESINRYNEQLAKGVSPEELMKPIYENSRDNARTPMQWSPADNAGFTDGKPWLNLNPNYPNINVEEALNNPDSIFYHYQKLIQLRKDNQVIVYGDFELIDKDNDEVFAYLRSDQQDTLLVINNFTGNSTTFRADVSFTSGTLLLSNDSESKEHITPADVENLALRPYESIIYRLS